MDERDDEKKRVLTPPADWADGMAHKTVSNPKSEDEQGEWAENDNFQVPPKAMPSSENLAATDGVKPASKSALGDSTPEQQIPALPWVFAVMALLLAVAFGALWSNQKRVSEAEVLTLKNTIRSMQRIESEQNALIETSAVEKSALQTQISSLKGQVNAMLLAQQSKSSNSATAEKKDDRKVAPPLQTGGEWFVNLESHRNKLVAEERLTTFRPKLLPMNISLGRAKVDKKTYYRIRAAGFSSKAEASVASEWIAGALQAGPFWVGKASKEASTPEPPPEPAPVKKQGSLDGDGVQASPLKNPKAQEPVQPRSPKSTADKWFIYVDTYDDKRTADVLTTELKNRGMNAVSAIEVRSGKLFYSVHIIDLTSQASGNIIAGQLRGSGFRNARMKRQVN